MTNPLAAANGAAEAGLTIGERVSDIIGTLRCGSLQTSSGSWTSWWPYLDAAACQWTRV